MSTYTLRGFLIASSPNILKCSFFVSFLLFLRVKFICIYIPSTAHNHNKLLELVNRYGCCCFCVRCSSSAFLVSCYYVCKFSLNKRWTKEIGRRFTILIKSLEVFFCCSSLLLLCFCFKETTKKRNRRWCTSDHHTHNHIDSLIEHSWEICRK